MPTGVYLHKLKRDLGGQRFGRLTVLKFKGRSRGRQSLWLCLCDCGNKTIVQAGNLKKENGTRSCGCLRKDIVDLTGKRFGRLTVIKFKCRGIVGNYSYWLCRCDCGKEKSTRGSSLKSGRVKSCGCLHDELARETMAKYRCSPPPGEDNPAYRHGHSGSPRSPTMMSYQAMKLRCYREGHMHYNNYGGRGIKICDKWLGKQGFINFLKDVGKRPPGTEAHRIDNDGNYEPGNFRWVSRKENINSIRRPLCLASNR